MANDVRKTVRDEVLGRGGFKSIRISGRAVCKSCPVHKSCYDKGNCHACEFGKAYFKLERKIKQLEAERREKRSDDSG